MKHPYFVLVILILLFTSCSSLKNSQNKELQFVNLNDTITKFVREYRDLYPKNSIIFLAFQNSISKPQNLVYVQRISNLSFLYFTSISYYTKIDGIPVVISSPKNGFVNPSYFDEVFINEMKLYLHDDLLMTSIVKNEYGGYDYEMVDYGVLTHSLIWKVKMGSKVQIETLKKDAPFLKKLIQDDVNLDAYYRVIEGGVDARKL